MIFGRTHDPIGRTEVWLVDYAEVRVGDELVVGGSAVRVRAVEPYNFARVPDENREALRAQFGADTRVAYWGAGHKHAMTLTSAGNRYRILPRPGEPEPELDCT